MDSRLLKRFVKWPWMTVTILIAAILNSGLSWVTTIGLNWPLFFDSIFTIVVGVFFGWLPGMLTGLVTNFCNEVAYGMSGTHWPFGLVNMATGICAGLMARNTERFWTISSQALFILLLTLVNSLLGAFVVTLLFGGLSGTHADRLVSALMVTGQGVASAAFQARILMNLVDKGFPVILLYIGHLVVESRQGSKPN